jgi:hypothetical protein
LNDERWTDEPPLVRGQVRASETAMSVMDTLLGDGTNG